jgi:hypothetical protein
LRFSVIEHCNSRQSKHNNSNVKHLTDIVTLKAGLLGNPAFNTKTIV